MFDRCSIVASSQSAVSAFRLIRLGGDDGTRTHDPLLANLTAAYLGERHGAYGLISGACGAGRTCTNGGGCSQNVPILEFEGNVQVGATNAHYTRIVPLVPCPSTCSENIATALSMSMM
jgi:hypothetical protein